MDISHPVDSWTISCSIEAAVKPLGMWANESRHYTVLVGMWKGKDTLQANAGPTAESKLASWQWLTLYGIAKMPARSTQRHVLLGHHCRWWGRPWQRGAWLTVSGRNGLGMGRVGAEWAKSGDISEVGREGPSADNLHSMLYPLEGINTLFLQIWAS